MAASNKPKKEWFYSTPLTDPFCLGHLRIHFGRDGDEFWSSFFEHANTDSLMTGALHTEINQNMRRFYDMGITAHLKGMRAYCAAHPEAAIAVLWDGCTKEYGFRMESEHLTFYIRCRPIRGDYQAYVYVYTRHFEEKLNE